MSDAEKVFRKMNNIPDLASYDEMHGPDYTDFQFNMQRTLINICRHLENNA